jgi:hypothetical protein
MHARLGLSQLLPGCLHPATCKHTPTLTNIGNHAPRDRCEDTLDCDCMNGILYCDNSHSPIDGPPHGRLNVQSGLRRRRHYCHTSPSCGRKSYISTAPILSEQHPLRNNTIDQEHQTRKSNPYCKYLGETVVATLRQILSPVWLQSTLSIKVSRIPRE